MNSAVVPLWNCLVFAAMLSAFLLYYLQRQGGLLAKALLGYFAICLTLIVFRWYFQPDLAIYDTSKYQSLAAQIAGLLRTDFWGNLPCILKPHAAYTLPLGLLYFVFGVSEPVGQLLNTVLGIGIILNVHRLADLWFNRRTADYTALVMILCPIFWLLGSTLNRDMMVAFGITLLFRLLSGLSERSRAGIPFWQGAAVLTTILWLTLLRPPLFILACLAVLVFWLVSHRRALRQGWLDRNFRRGSILLLLIVAGFGLIVAGKQYQSRSPLDYEITKFSNLESMNERLRNSEGAGSAYFRGVSYDSYWEVVKAVPLATVYFLFSPFPWQVVTFKQALGLVDSVWILFLCWFFLKGIGPFCRHQPKIALALLAFMIVGIAASSVLQANAGSALRHRTMFSFLMVPVAVYGLAFRRAARSLVRVRCQVPA
ncbi:MAG: hypothetical protein ACUVXF_05890 [Desulfobaccales bacterium]